METLPHEIRFSEAADLPFLKKWLADPEVIKWLSFTEGSEEEHAVQGWGSFFRIRAGLTATIDGEPVGMGLLYLMPYQKVAHQCQFKVVVNPSFQKKGIGFSLIKNLKHLAKNYFKQEFLLVETMKGNRIESLLLKQGFEKIFEQDAYFKVGDLYLARQMFMVDLRSWEV